MINCLNLETLPITSLVDYPQSPEHEDQDTHQEKSKSSKIKVSKETVEKIPPSSEEKEASKSGIFLRLGKKVSEALKEKVYLRKQKLFEMLIICGDEGANFEVKLI